MVNIWSLDTITLKVERIGSCLFLFADMVLFMREVAVPPPYTACMREQLAQALATQQVLTVERDQAREQCQLARERAAALQQQLEGLRQSHGQCLDKQYCSGIHS